MDDSVIVNWITAISTASAVLYVLFKDILNLALNKPKCEIMIHNIEGYLTFYNVKNTAHDPNIQNTSRDSITQTSDTEYNINCWFYHLKVVNLNKRTIIENCNVLLFKIEKLIDNNFIEIPNIIPLPFHWSPSELALNNCIIVTEQVFDFLYISELDGDSLKPALRMKPNNFIGDIKANETVRYHIKIDAKNYISKKVHIYEVFWNGEWSDDPIEMKNYLKIIEIRK